MLEPDQGWAISPPPLPLYKPCPLPLYKLIWVSGWVTPLFLLPGQIGTSLCYLPPVRLGHTLPPAWLVWGQTTVLASRGLGYAVLFPLPFPHLPQRLNHAPTTGLYEDWDLPQKLNHALTSGLYEDWVMPHPPCGARPSPFPCRLDQGWAAPRPFHPNGALLHLPWALDWV